MQIKELLTESYIHRDIPKILKAKGYLGPDGGNSFFSGADQLVALEPDTGMILKIFGTTRTKSSNTQLTKGQRAWVDFSKYCLQHPNNPFLPQFQGWETFEYKGKTYLQIRSERLFPLIGEGAQSIKNGLVNMSYHIEDDYSYNKTFELIMDDNPELITYLSEEEFKLLYKTISDLKDMSISLDINLDLHGGNFMQTSDGQLVINDPFHSEKYFTQQRY